MDGLAILAQANRLAVLDGLPQQDAGQNMFFFVFVAGRQEAHDRLADHFFCRKSEDFFRSLVPACHHAMHVFSDDGVFRRFNNRRQSRPGLINPPALCNVSIGNDNLQSFTRRIDDGRGADFGDCVGARINGMEFYFEVLHTVAAQRARARPLFLRNQFPVKCVCLDHSLDGFKGESPARQAKEMSSRGIHLDKVIVLVQNNDSFRQAVEDRPELDLALRQLPGFHPEAAGNDRNHQYVPQNDYCCDRDDRQAERVDGSGIRRGNGD